MLLRFHFRTKPHNALSDPFLIMKNWFYDEGSWILFPRYMCMAYIFSVKLLKQLWCVQVLLSQPVVYWVDVCIFSPFVSLLQNPRRYLRIHQHKIIAWEPNIITTGYFFFSLGVTFPVCRLPGSEWFWHDVLWLALMDWYQTWHAGCLVSKPMANMTGMFQKVVGHIRLILQTFLTTCQDGG